MFREPGVDLNSIQAAGSYSPPVSAPASLHWIDPLTGIGIDMGMMAGSGLFDFIQGMAIVPAVINAHPTLDEIPDPPVINEDAGMQVVRLGGIGAGGGESHALRIEATSSHPELIGNLRLCQPE